MKTSRLIFRTWLETDLEFAMGLWGDLRVTKFIDARGELLEDDVRNRLFQEINSEKNYGVQYWPIFLRSTNDHIGCCGLRAYDLLHNVFEIGFHIRADHWGRGFATEAAIGVMDYAFNVLSVKGLFAGHHPHNKASQHMMSKLGFSYTHDEYYAPTEMHHPSYILTVDEYRRIKKWAAANCRPVNHAVTTVDNFFRKYQSRNKFVIYVKRLELIQVARLVR